MNALVVYESLWGNTEQIARSIADGLSTQLSVRVVEVSEAPATVPEDIRLLVIGGPTHAFSMTRPATRKDAFTQGATQGSETRGIREWIDGLAKRGPGVQVATFDTRVEKARRLPGSAAKKSAQMIRKLGFALLTKPESFWVVGTDGPLVDGELVRAKSWGYRLGTHAESRATTRS